MKKYIPNNYVFRLLCALVVCVSLTYANPTIYGVCHSEDMQFNFHWCYNPHEAPMKLYTERFGTLGSDLFTLTEDNVDTLFIPYTNGKMAYVPDDSFSINHNTATNLWTFRTKS